MYHRSVIMSIAYACEVKLSTNFCLVLKQFI